MNKLPRIALVRFPGSNCDADMIDAIKRVSNIQLEDIWHESENWSSEFNAAILPGGFSYGDFLRAGALASHSPAMKEIKKLHETGGYILGVCNGFQILTEANLLPGALIGNSSGKFICHNAKLTWDKENCEFRGASWKAQSLRSASISLPIAHGEGRFFIENEGLKELKKHNQILLRYSENPNGSTDDIACIQSKCRRVIGLMPHPERALDFNNQGDGFDFLSAFIQDSLNKETSA